MGEKLQFTELDQYLFGQGTHYDIYKKLGAHPTMRGRKKGVRKVYILLCGHQMPDQFLLLESLITGIHRQIQ